MNEYIERANALQYYQLICRGIACKDCRFHEYNHCKIELFLANLPAADVVERKRGKWIRTPTEPLGYTCSVCGKACYKFNFCPNCGADMRGDE